MTLAAVGLDVRSPPEIVVEHGVVEALAEQGGSVFVWACRRCCGGTMTLEASSRAPDAGFELVASEPLRVYARPGARLPHAIHLDLDRKGRVRAFWDGLVWVV